ncbi:MAG: 5-formyltetrahydrofolate cyclo-ligase, partial [Williamsia herbipolensis]|nr:5-formyltetrahydrofolate cyclo-ligase [Williamsia herbipolensis]
MSTPPRPHDAPPPDADKEAWRQWALARRRARDSRERDELRAALADRLLSWPHLPAGATVCSYLPLRTEPLPVAASDALVRQGHRVLVPVTRAGQPLGWADHVVGRSVEAGVHGVPDPGPALPPDEESAALSGAFAVLVPALLVDTGGVRLGRGGGHYDRSFATPPLVSIAHRIAVVFDDEVVDA